MSTTISPQSVHGLLRQSSLALTVSGLLTVASALLHPDEAAHPEAMVSTFWVIVHSGTLVSAILLLFGLLGLSLKQAEAMDRWGWLGFGLTFIGAALFTAVFFFETLAMPVLAGFPGALDAVFNGAMGLVLLVTGILFSIGTVLLGIAIVRAAVLPRWAGLLLLIAGPLTGFAGILPHLPSMIGIGLFGLTLTWLGVALGRDQAEAMVALQPAGRTN